MASSVSVPDGPAVPPVDCSALASFLEDEVMALSHTASFGASCVTIETLVQFNSDGTAQELDADGNILASFSYLVTEVEGQCALASTVSDCEVQLLSFNGDESAMIMTLDGAEATLTPTTCPFPPEMGDVTVSNVPTAFDAADGALEVTIADGVPTSIALTGVNGGQDYSFAYPGDVDGILAGSYSVTALDADDCASNAISVMVPYAICCDCGVSDADTDGICDDSDNCTDRTASNYADPANGICTYD